MKTQFSITFTLFIFVFSSFSYGQVNCDGFLNPNIDNYTSCPTSISQLYLLDNWNQVTNSTTDWYCDCSFPWNSDVGDCPSFAENFIGGYGYVLNDNGVWVEYVGQCLTQPFLQDEIYTITFDIFQSLGTDDHVINIYGYVGLDCPNTPINTTDDLAFEAGWEVIGSVVETSEVTDLSFTTLSTTITMQNDYSYIAFGEGIISNPQYGNTYFCYDNFCLSTVSDCSSIQVMANTINDLNICDDNDDGQITLDLQDYNDQVLGNQPASDYEISYHTSQSDAANDANPLSLTSQVFSNPSQTVYVRIESNENPVCYESTSFLINIYTDPIATTPTMNLEICDDDMNDGYVTISLLSYDSQILNGQSPNLYEVNYYETFVDAQSQINELDKVNYINANPYEQLFFVRVHNTIIPDCYDINSFTINIRNSPQLELPTFFSICEGETSIDISIQPDYDLYLWSDGQSSPTATFTSSGNYSVQVGNVFNNIICYSEVINFEIEDSSKATLEHIEIIDWTNNLNSIEVFVTGDGDYEFAIQDEVGNISQYQDSNIFNGLKPGIYNILINDKNGCGMITHNDVYLLYYPKFFTPNGDTYNDFWQIIASESEPNLIIYIFDRYGKLIKQLSPTSLGWDGTSNGYPLPAADYWFRVVRPNNGKEYKGHFTLKR